KAGLPNIQSARWAKIASGTRLSGAQRRISRWRPMPAFVKSPHFSAIGQVHPSPRQTDFAVKTRPLKLAVLTFAALIFAAMTARAEPSAAGLWEKVDENGRTVVWFLFAERNGSYEGAIAKLFKRPEDADKPPNCVRCTDDRKNAPMLGLPLVRGMKRNG